MLEKKKEQSQPTIDSRVQVKGLEAEVCLMSQKVDDTKSKNSLIGKELNELRRNVKLNKE